MPKITLAAVAFATACALAPTVHAQQLSEQWLDYECSRASLPDPQTSTFRAGEAGNNFCLNYLRAIIETVSILHVEPPPFCIPPDRNLYDVVRRYQTFAGLIPGMPMPALPLNQVPATERAIAVLKLAYPCD